MPLRDHFHPPVGHQLPWESLHSGWIARLAERLNELLPEGYVALDTVRVGGRLEIDVGTFEGEQPSPPPGANGPAGGVAVAPVVYRPPPAVGSFPVNFPDVAEVRVFTDRGGRQLVGAVELVSPGNKDRGGKLEGFVAKCVGYLTGGASLVVVDVVTDRRGVVHNDILRELGAPAELEPADDRTLYATAYRPVMSSPR